MLKKILGGVLISLFLFSVSSWALDLRAGDVISIPKGEVINDNLLVAGDTINISGDINGDLMAFGSKITIQGDVQGNVFAAGERITLDGVVKNDLFIGGNKVFLSDKSRVGKDVFLGCGTAHVSGKIYRDLKVGCGELTVAPSALVKGKLDYSAQKFDISDRAKMLGAITSHVRPDYEKDIAKVFTGVVITSQIIGFLTMLLLGILAIVFLPNQVKLVTSKMTGEFWKSLGWGILSLIVIPFIILLFFISVIGIPLGILLLVAYIFGMYITGIFISVVIGSWIFGKLGKPAISLIWALILGLILLKLIGWIPIVGWIVGLIFFLWAFGALVSTRFVYYKEAREKGIM
ncbi:hypothetical protein AMJ44_11160 [candidate division WOR-1 bacterium DG_54_3]|uniref:Polymer-forming cytoskeletal protein n=1 Tax=candidate division WOR-1 bacterium DG_54_3 TaxID=1703775 RepID=A0A0S7XRI3_UNCSA|nr:MAG: hypothetical protein AMJ44_11160 [candidate division WOR-1 bacterium DG_54_3]